MNALDRGAKGKFWKRQIFWTLLLFPLVLNAQSIVSVRYSPESSNFLGHLMYFSKLDFEYSQIVFHKNRILFHPGIRMTFLNFHQGNHIGYTDRYGVPPSQKFMAFGLVPGAFSERLFDKVPVYLDESVGVDYFPKKFPNKNGKNFNIILEAGVHVTIWKMVTLGYRYSHVSNVWTGRINPGLDSNMFSLGFIIP
ncbi:MAG TPA: acyloxyacyl hydrolase [Balneolales bacterium]|nr:acyloxyacyl hydrolase [Balneolales bacterium]